MKRIRDRRIDLAFTPEEYERITDYLKDQGRSADKFSVEKWAYSTLLREVSNHHSPIPEKE